MAKKILDRFGLPLRAGAEGMTKISDVIVPEIFNPNVQQITEEKSRIVQSGAVVRDPQIDNELAGGGVTFNTPSYKDLDNVEENISSDDQGDKYTGGTNDSKPQKTGMANEVSVRLSRNQSWSSGDLTAALQGSDPMDSIASRVGNYRALRMQAAFIATMKGIFADNDAAPTSGEHVQGDLTNDIKGASVSEATKFSAPAFLDACVTMGDSQEDLGLVMVHSIVYNRMQKQNLIDFVPDARGEVRIPTFLGRTVVVDDSMPKSGGVYETWMFGAGAVRIGMGNPKVPTETKRDPDSGNGAGSEILYNRWEWCIHPTGHAFAVAASGGGPSNAATAGNLAHADSWKRVYSERKQIKIARLITREHA
ncbi:MAG: putative major capsid protein [Prokaryotic dsDNA virus sp.]|nr:MAG: putative major capsid protein [Prokaryotic dsDNA virus sp.]|tara:strand:- start:48512 stop:49606 length:1095 start_codon:yes stop_codon:yes gene_type:complete